MFLASLHDEFALHSFPIFANSAKTPQCRIYEFAIKKIHDMGEKELKSESTVFQSKESRSERRFQNRRLMVFFKYLRISRFVKKIHSDLFARSFIEIFFFPHASILDDNSEFEVNFLSDTFCY